MSRKTQHKVEVNSVMTNKPIIATKVRKHYKKNVVTLNFYVSTMKAAK